jgi:hypothetical protein
MAAANSSKDTVLFIGLIWLVLNTYSIAKATFSGPRGNKNNIYGVIALHSNYSLVGGLL